MRSSLAMLASGNSGARVPLIKFRYGKRPAATAPETQHTAMTAATNNNTNNNISSAGPRISGARDDWQKMRLRRAPEKDEIDAINTGISFI